MVVVIVDVEVAIMVSTIAVVMVIAKFLVMLRYRTPQSPSCSTCPNDQLATAMRS